MFHTLDGQNIATYGGLARAILIQITRLINGRVDLLFDTYAEPSIKDSERLRRNETDQGYIISGADQRCPKKFADALKSRSFKQGVPNFFASEWAKPEYASMIGNRKIYLGFSTTCYCFWVQDEIVMTEVIPDLQCNHYEADTRICLHLREINKVANCKNIGVRALDTDIAVILIHHLARFHCNIWMDVGTRGKNNRRFINVTSIVSSLGNKMCAALPAFHAYTGSDYTSAFVRKGKIRPFLKLQNNNDAQTAFAELGRFQSLSSTTEEALQIFTSCIQGAKGQGCDLNEHRFKVVEKAYSPKPGSKSPLDRLKGIDGSLTPPCKAELREHIRLSSFVARIWVNANCNYIEQDPRP